MCVEDAEMFGCLLALNRDVHDVPLPIYEQERKVGRFQRISKTLEGRKVAHKLPVELQHHIAGLQAGRLSQTAFFNIGDDDSTIHR